MSEGKTQRFMPGTTMRYSGNVREKENLRAEIDAAHARAKTDADRIADLERQNRNAERVIVELSSYVAKHGVIEGVRAAAAVGGLRAPYVDENIIHAVICRAMEEYDRVMEEKKNGE
ncbi:MAG: hypothetical protein ACPG6R_10860 [Aequoribacter sp.]|uniref:hypothetical protein n=1 Tax=Aequoribacter sp. TaxID=2847771 RepID=UPI003C4B3680